MLIGILPLFVLAVLLICSPYTGWLYYFDENKIYHRGPLYYSQQILAYCYILYSSFKTLLLAMNKKYYAHRDDFLTIASFAVPPILCGLLQSILQRLPILSVGIVISFLLVYIGTLQSFVSLDSLTGMSNRRELLVYLASKIENLKKEEKLYFLFIDVDSFKQINDSYGHTEGDRVLKMISSAIKKVCRETKGFCARYGGDEFAIVQIINKEERIEPMCKMLTKAVEQKSESEGTAYSVKISIGSAVYLGENDSIQELILRADSEMYNEKNMKRIRFRHL